MFAVEEQDKAVVVKIADRQWRYSRYPEVPLFGRAARKTVWKLHAERETLAERYATLSFDVQKTQRYTRPSAALSAPSGGGVRR